jgi:uncharacterized protein (DUF4415 family)
MKKQRIVRYIPREGDKGRTDWERIRRQTDEDIARAVASDPDAAPIMPAEWWREATLVLPATKVPVSVRLDRDVLEWFKQQGPRYQSRINAVLRAYMKANSKDASAKAARAKPARAKAASAKRGPSRRGSRGVR